MEIQTGLKFYNSTPILKLETARVVDPYYRPSEELVEGVKYTIIEKSVDDKTVSIKKEKNQVDLSKVSATYKGAVEVPTINVLPIDISTVLNAGYNNFESLINTSITIANYNASGSNSSSAMQSAPKDISSSSGSGVDAAGVMALITSLIDISATITNIAMYEKQFKQFADNINSMIELLDTSIESMQQGMKEKREFMERSQKVKQRVQNQLTSIKGEN